MQCADFLEMTTTVVSSFQPTFAPHKHKLQFKYYTYLASFYSAAALLAMQSAVIPTAIPSVCLSVRPSVRPSVTRWYHIQTNERRISRSSL